MHKQTNQNETLIMFIKLLTISKYMSSTINYYITYDKYYNAQQFP